MIRGFFFNFLKDFFIKSKKMYKKFMSFDVIFMSLGRPYNGMRNERER